MPKVEIARTIRGRLFPSADQYGEAEEVDNVRRTPNAFRAQQLAIRVVESTVDEWSQVAGSGRLTDTGVTEELRDRLPKALEQLKPARNLLAGMTEDLKKAEAELTPFKPLDPGDAVSASRQAELRSYLRGLPHEKRLEIVNRAITNGEEEILRAVAEGQPFLTGITPQFHALVCDSLLEARHPEKLRATETLRERVGLLDKTLRTAEAILREAAGVMDFERVGVVGDLPGPIRAPKEKKK